MLIKTDVGAWSEALQTAFSPLTDLPATNVQEAIEYLLGLVLAAAPLDAEFIVGSPSSGLSAERVLTDNTHIAWDLATPAQVKATIVEPELAAIAGLTSAADRVPYFTGSGTAALGTFTSYGRSLVAVADEAAFKALVNLEAGVDYQAFDTDLAAIAALTTTTIGRSLLAAANAAAIATIAGVGTGDSPQFTAVNVGDATDTTITRVSAGVIAVEGVTILTTATGQPLDADLTAIAALTTTSFGRSVLTQAAAANLATLAGVGTGDSPQFTAVNVGAATDTTITRVSAGLIAVEGNTVLTTATGQPLDADLTAIAALTTNAAGRAFLQIADPNTDTIYFWDDSAGIWAGLVPTPALEISGTSLRVIESITIAASDETTNITTGTNKVTWRMPYAFTLTAVRASVNTAPVGSTIIIDINEGGTTILSTKLSIDASELTSTTAASAAVISDTALADDAAMSIDFDQVGSSTPGKGVKVTLIGYRP